jgi:hypothetical protein
MKTFFDINAFAPEEKIMHEEFVVWFRRRYRK